MKIEIELPKWTEERVIHVLAGIERVAYKYPWEKSFKVKTGRCSMCGRCCKKIDCEHLEKEPGDNDKWRCSLGTMRPYNCCVSRPRKIKECTVEFKEI